MVPLKVDEESDLIYTFQVKLNSELYARTYKANLPVYENYMEPGYSYTYIVTLNSDTITFNNVTISPWIDVTIEDQPIVISSN